MPEVIFLVRFEEGRLLFYPENRPVSLFIGDYSVLCAYQGVEPVPPQGLVPLLAGLAGDRQVRFQFDAGVRAPELCPPPPPEGTPLAYPLRISFLLDHLERFLDSANVSSDLLPHPDAKFALAEGTAGQEAVPPDLVGFVAHLSRPASAREIARRTGLPLEIVRVGLYRLRLREIVVPFEPRSGGTIGDERKGLLSQLLKWLGGGGHWART